MTNNFITADSMNYRHNEREKVEKLQQLTKKAKELRSNGLSTSVSRIEQEILGLKRELNIKSKATKLTPAEREAKIKKIKERLRK